MEIEASQPTEYTLCPWKRVDDLSLEVEVCIRMKNHDGDHDWRGAGHVNGQH